MGDAPKRWRIAMAVEGCLCALLLAAPGGATEAAPAPATADATESGPTNFMSGLSLGSPDEPLVVESKRLEFDYQRNYVVYRGDVHVTQGDLTIDCDELIVNFQSADDLKQAELSDVVAVGDVVITQGQRRATGGQAVFCEKTRQIVLLEDPVLRDGPNEVKGDRLTVYLDEGRSVIESTSKKRVSAVLYPESAKKEPKEGSAAPSPTPGLASTSAAGPTP